MVARVVLMDERRVDSRVVVEEEGEVSTNWVSQQTCRKRLLAWCFQCEHAGNKLAIPV